MYVNKTHTIQQLKENIRIEVKAQHSVTLVIEHAVQRVHYYEVNNRRHLKDHFFRNNIYKFSVLNLYYKKWKKYIISLNPVVT